MLYMESMRSSMGIWCLVMQLGKLLMICIVTKIFAGKVYTVGSADCKVGAKNSKLYQVIASTMFYVKVSGTQDYLMHSNYPLLGLLTFRFFWRELLERMDYLTGI